MQLLIFVILLLFTTANAQESLTYQKPSKEILDLVDVPLAPRVIFDANKEFMIFQYRDAYKSIEELSQEEMRLGGLRINPKTNIGSRERYYNNLKIKNLKNDKSEVVQVSGLPVKPKLTNLTFSPDQKKIAMTNTTSLGVEIWVVDLVKSSAKRLTEPKVNANLRSVINWFEDGNSLLVKMVSEDRKELIDTKIAVPTGPTISVSDGKEAQNRTYQDLLKNKNDEHNFEQLALSELYKISLDGKSEKWLESAMFSEIEFSPNGEYIMVETIEKPFSYLVPYYRFASKTVIYSKDGKKVRTVAKTPLIEDLPKGFMAVHTGRRKFSWRDDKPASLIFAQALDEGNPEKEAEFRDEVFQLNPPFNKEPKSLIKTKNRYYKSLWGNEETAIIYDYWWNNRNMKTYLFNPSSPYSEAKIIFDRNYQDKYSDPGDFVTKRNKMGSDVLALKGKNAFLKGDGFSDKGQFPFLDKINLESQKTNRIYQSKFTDKLESLNEFDAEKNQIIVRIESPDEYPNYFIRDLEQDQLSQLTNFDNPFKSIQGIHKEVISYKREDGLELSGTLYLPIGYDKKKKEKMPMILWAYPKEFKNQASA